MNILLTGGAGFIGSHLAKKLLQKNYDITIVDNFHSYYSIARKKEQLEQVKKKGQVAFFEYDLRNEDACRTIFQEKKYDAVIHLAALPGVSYSIENPMSYVDYDIKATINVLKAAGEEGVKHVIFASSSSVYGDSSKQPVQEWMATGKVSSPYAASKYGAESFCHAYQHLFGFQLTILRFFTVYGTWGRPDMAIPTFISLLQKGKPINVYGQQTARDYTYIEDIVNGIELALYSKKDNEIYNIGAGNPVTMEELLKVLKTHFPKMKVNSLPFRKGDVTITWADISKAREELGYEPKVGIEEGIKRIVDWTRKYEN